MRKHLSLILVLAMAATFYAAIAVVTRTIDRSVEPSAPEADATGCSPVDGWRMQPRAAVSDSDFLEFHRGACSGSCPVFTLRINGDGTLLWTGEKSVQKLGAAKAQISAGAAKSLIRQFRREGFWSTCDSYRLRVPDLPSVTVIAEIGGHAKKVNDYGMAGPDWLLGLYSQLDNLAVLQKWLQPGLTYD